MIQEIAEKSVKPKIRLKVTEDYKFVNDVVNKIILAINLKT